MSKEIDKITGEIVDAAIKLHSQFGPGLLESVYEMVLARELERRGFRVQQQEPISFEYDGLYFEEAFRVDLLIEGIVIVELKSVEKPAPVHAKQLLTYLRLLNLPVGLLINFGCVTLKEGLQRVVNDYRPTPGATVGLRVNEVKLLSMPISSPKDIDSRGDAENAEMLIQILKSNDVDFP